MKDINQKYTNERISPGEPSDMMGVEAQTESGELVITPDGDIANVAAKRKHSEMDEDEVTDILEEGSYVLSHAEDGSMNITREEAEAEVFGTGASIYRENGVSVPGKEKTLADFFPKGVDEMTPADLGRRIRSAYPMSQQDDVYAKKSNSMNKANRENAVLALVKLNEKKRLAKDGPDELNEVENIEVPAFNPGGPVTGYLTDMFLGNPIDSAHGQMDAIERINEATSNPYLEYFANRNMPGRNVSKTEPIQSAYERMEPSPGKIFVGRDEAGNPIYREVAEKPEDQSGAVGERTEVIDDDVATQSDGFFSGLTDLERQFKEKQDELNAQLDKVRKDYSDFMEESTAKAQERSKNAMRDYLEQVRHANRVFDRQSAVGFAGNLAINAAQSPRVDSIDFSDQINAAKSELDRTPEYLKEYQSKGLAAQARNNAKAMFDSTSQFNRAAANMNAVNAQAMNALSDIAVANNQMEIDQFNKRAATIGGLRSQQDLADVNRANAERSNLNQKIAAYGNSLENYLGELKMGDMMEGNAKIQARNAMNQADSEYQTRREYLKLREASDQIRDLELQKSNNERWMAAMQNRINGKAPELYDQRDFTVRNSPLLGVSIPGNNLFGENIPARATIYNNPYMLPKINPNSGAALQGYLNTLSENNYYSGGESDPMKPTNGLAWNNALTFTNDFLGNELPSSFAYPGARMTQEERARQLLYQDENK